MVTWGFGMGLAARGATVLRRSWVWEGESERGEGEEKEREKAKQRTVCLPGKGRISFWTAELMPSLSLARVRVARAGDWGRVSLRAAGGLALGLRLARGRSGVGGGSSSWETSWAARRAARLEEASWKGAGLVGARLTTGAGAAFLAGVGATGGAGAVAASSKLRTRTWLRALVASLGEWGI